MPQLWISFNCWTIRSKQSVSLLQYWFDSE